MGAHMEKEEGKQLKTKKKTDRWELTGRGREKQWKKRKENKNMETHIREEADADNFRSVHGGNFVIHHHPLIGILLQCLFSFI